MEKIFEVVIADEYGCFEKGVLALENEPELNSFLRMVLCVDGTGVSYYSRGFVTQFREIEPSKLFEETQIKPEHLVAQ